MQSRCRTPRQEALASSGKQLKGSPIHTGVNESFIGSKDADSPTNLLNVTLPTPLFRCHNSQDLCQLKGSDNNIRSQQRGDTARTQEQLESVCALPSLQQVFGEKCRMGPLPRTKPSGVSAQGCLVREHAHGLHHLLANSSFWVGQLMRSL